MACFFIHVHELWPRADACARLCCCGGGVTLSNHRLHRVGSSLLACYTDRKRDVIKSNVRTLSRFSPVRFLVLTRVCCPLVLYVYFYISSGDNRVIP